VILCEDSSMAEWRVARLEEIDEATDGRAPWRPVRHHLGIRSFGLNAWTGHDVGDRIINEHDEGQPDDPEELYVVLQGRARFALDGETVDAPAGTFVFVPPGTTRTAFAEEPETAVLAFGGVPGKAYEPLDWETWAPLQPLYAERRYDEAVAAGRERLAQFPEAPLLLYNLACCEALTGQTSEALEHLSRAAAQSDRLRRGAANDDDFASLHDEPAFREIVAG
jgi:tetratricopeptide (TPR) repeat protein